MKITENITINAPIKNVFKAFTDLSIAEKNISGIEKIEILHGSKQLTENTRWKETRKILGQEASEEMWVTKIDDEASYEVEAESHGTKYKTVYTFKKEDKSTVVTMEFEAIPNTLPAKIMNISGFLMRGATKKLLRKDLIDLKNYLEK